MASLDELEVEVLPEDGEYEDGGEELEVDWQELERQRGELEEIERESEDDERLKGLSYSKHDDLSFYIQTVCTYKLLKKDEERELFESYVRTKGSDDEVVQQENAAIRERIILHNVRLVVSLAKYYRNKGLEFMDLIQEGNFGLMHALDRFDPGRGWKFSTYATWWIRQKINRAIQDKGKTIRVPVHAHSKMSLLRNTEWRFLQEHGRDATPEELGELLQMKPEKIRKLSALCRQLNTASFEQAIAMPRGDSDDVTIEDALPDPGSEMPSVFAEVEMEIDHALKELDLMKERLARRLSARKCDVFHRLYGLHDNSFVILTLEQAAHQFGITRERVRQIEVQACRVVRKTKKEMRKFVRSISLLREMSIAATIDTPHTIVEREESEVEYNPPPKARLVVSKTKPEPVVPPVPPAPVNELDEKLVMLPKIDVLVFRSFYGMEDPTVKGLEKTAESLGMGRANVERIVGRVWLRLRNMGYSRTGIDLL